MLSEVMFDIVGYVSRRKSNGYSIEVCVADKPNEDQCVLYLTSEDEFSRKYYIKYSDLFRLSEIINMADGILENFRSEHNEALTQQNRI